MYDNELAEDFFWQTICHKEEDLEIVNFIEYIQNDFKNNCGKFNIKFAEVIFSNCREANIYSIFYLYGVNIGKVDVNAIYRALKRVPSDKKQAFCSFLSANYSYNNTTIKIYS